MVACSEGCACVEGEDEGEDGERESGGGKAGGRREERREGGGREGGCSKRQGGKEWQPTTSKSSICFCSFLEESSRTSLSVVVGTNVS